MNRKISIAPMIDYTDRHFRYFARLMSKNVLLYTEMITTNAILKGDAKRYLYFDKTEHPVAIQLGGSNPKDLADAAKIAEDYGYDEINLNVGCPSARVQNGLFGACLMAKPKLVAECVAAMQQAVRLSVTVKTRIGIDHQDSYENLNHFIHTVKTAGCHTFIIHARKAWLIGLNPKQNRTIPPLKYDVVYQLKRDFPELEIIINGGISTHAQIDEQLKHVDGVMIGRKAYHDPYLLAGIDQRYFASKVPIKSRSDILATFTSYIEKELRQGTRLNLMIRPILGLYQGIPGVKAWRRYLVTEVCNASRGLKLDYFSE